MGLQCLEEWMLVPIPLVGLVLQKAVFVVPRILHCSCIVPVLFFHCYGRLFPHRFFGYFPIGGRLFPHCGYFPTCGYFPISQAIDIGAALSFLNG